MKKVRIYPYKMASQSAKMLQAALDELEVDCLRVKRNGEYIPKNDHLIVGWGNGHYPTWDDYVKDKLFLNKPLYVSTSVNKEATFKACENTDIPIPERTPDPTIAMEWLLADGKVIGRGELEGKDGSGLVQIAHPCELLRYSHLPLFTRFVKKREEWRVHVFLGRVIAAQVRRAFVGGEVTNPDICTTGYGWGLSYKYATVPEVVQEVGIRAIAALRLDFGAVDIAETMDGGAVVFETNTAPELSPLTAQKYARAIKQHL